MLNVKKTLTKLIGLFDELIVFGDKTAEAVSVSANSTKTYTLDFAKTGYTVLGVKRVNWSNTSCVLGGFSFTNDAVTVVLRNVTSASANCNCRVQVAYIKNAIIGGGTP